LQYLNFQSLAKLLKAARDDRVARERKSVPQRGLLDVVNAQVQQDTVCSIARLRWLLLNRWLSPVTAAVTHAAASGCGRHRVGRVCIRVCLAVF
jgi:hypothetical protein